jgi:hypothetical protein
LDIPPEVAIKASIKPGSVYYFSSQHLHSPAAHYFVVLNIDPIAEEAIILICAVSESENVRQRNKNNNPRKTLVVVQPEQYPEFTRPTIFDCNNNIFVEKIEILVERLSQKRLELKPRMDMALVKQLRQGVFASRLIALNIKQQLGMGKPTQ